MEREEGERRGFRARRQLQHLKETYKQTAVLHRNGYRESGGSWSPTLFLSVWTTVFERILLRDESEIHACAHIR